MTGRPPRGLLFRTKTAAIHTTFQRIRITRRIHRIIGNISVIRIIIIFRSLYDRACAARNLGLIYLLYLRKETLEASHCRYLHETDHRNLRVRHAADIPFHLGRDRANKLPDSSMFFCKLNSSRKPPDATHIVPPPHDTTSRNGDRWDDTRRYFC